MSLLDGIGSDYLRKAHASGVDTLAAMPAGKKDGKNTEGAAILAFGASTTQGATFTTLS